MILRRHTLFLISLLLLLLAILYINPVREVTVDDGWAYARTTQHLFTTREYKLDAWLAANMPLLAYWGSAFSSILGYSLTTLRISVLVLAFVALMACYGLAKAHDFTNSQAGLLTLVLATSPLILYLSFVYSTDVPHMALLFLAIFLYTSALKQGSIKIVFLASVAAAGAIMIRQFGVALLAGLWLCWLFDSRKWQSLPLYVVGTLLPAGAAIWQIYVGALAPNWAARFVIQVQSTYYAQPLLSLANETIWRVGITALYLALFIAPLALIPLREYRRQLRVPARLRHILDVIVISALATFFFILLSAQRSTHLTLMPYLGWNFNVSAYGQLLLSFVLFISSVVLLPVFIQRVRSFFSLPRHERLVDLIALSSLGLILLFYKIGDQYLIVLLPFGLIAIGKALEQHLLLRKRIITFACVTSLVLASLWIRAGIAYNEATWNAADSLRLSGVSPDEIAASWTWNSYYGLFDKYVEFKGEQMPDSFDEFFNEWIPAHQRDARFTITNEPETVDGQIVDTFTYYGAFFEPLHMYVVDRQP